jgi:hypothetical protein
LRIRVFLAAACLAVAVTATVAGTAGAASKKSTASKVTKQYCVDGTTATVDDATLQGRFQQFQLDAAINIFGGVFFDLQGRHQVAAGACPVVDTPPAPAPAVAPTPTAPPDAVPAPAAPDRAGYCLNGKFEDLIWGEPNVNPDWAGATPANYVQGIGITCGTPGPDYVLEPGVLVGGDGWVWPSGIKNPSAIYPYYAKTG